MTPHPFQVHYHDDGYRLTFDPPLVIYRDGLRTRDLGAVRTLEIKPNGATYWVTTDVWGGEPVTMEVQR